MLTTRNIMPFPANDAETHRHAMRNEYKDGRGKRIRNPRIRGTVNVNVRAHSTVHIESRIPSQRMARIKLRHKKKQQIKRMKCREKGDTECQ